MRVAVAMNALLAWVGILLNVVATVFAGRRPVDVDPGLYGSVPGGPWMHVLDVFSYFTIWSTVVVAISTTLLALDPHRDTAVRRALRLSGLLMITVTAIVYAVLLAPVTKVEGWSVVTNPWVHILVPAVTVLVWLIWGPRRWISARTLLAALVIPILWIAYALVRGAIDGLYPYGFMNVTERGYPAVALTVLAILAFALLLAVVFGLVDRLLSRRTPAPTGDRGTSRR